MKPSDRRVLLIGDSLTVACQEAVEGLFADADVELQVRAENGRTIRSAVAIIQSAGRRSDVVVALGTNDVGAAASTLDELIDDVIDAACETDVWWVDTAISDGRHDGVNAALERATLRHPTLRTVRWSRCVDLDPTVLGHDGIHLSSAGAQQRARLIAGDVLR